MTIYLLRNRVTGRVYIGKTSKSLEERWQTHLRDSRAGSSLPTHNAIRKYGPDAFEVVLLSTYALSIQDLNQVREKLAENCRKMAAARKGVSLPSRLRAIQPRFTDRHHTSATRKRIARKVAAYRRTHAAK
jgi:hypothetical protein